jgi:hypothetical protein
MGRPHTLDHTIALQIAKSPQAPLGPLGCDTDNIDPQTHHVSCLSILARQGHLGHFALQLALSFHIPSGCPLTKITLAALDLDIQCDESRPHIFYATANSYGLT